MSDLTADLLAAVVAASPDRKELALRVLRGELPQSPGKVLSGPLLMAMGAGAKFLGVSRATLWRACLAGRIQKVELFPGSYRVRREDLEALAAGRMGISEYRSKRGRPKKAPGPVSPEGGYAAASRPMPDRKEVAAEQ
jgi:hypothetical protein